MKWTQRFGLSMMLIMIYTMLGNILPETVTGLQRGFIGVIFIVGYALFLTSDGKD